MMSGLIKTDLDLCTGCNRCVRECPMETANITYQDENKNIKVKVDREKCITCGRCFSVCSHDARDYEDDTARFFGDLANGVSISLIAAPSVRTNIREYRRLFTYLKNAGVKKIYDVSLGADICIWAHVRHIEENKPASMITQPCPVIVSYCETYRHELLDRLSPIHSPMACIAIYVKEYEGITDKIASLSPCIAKSSEFEETGLAQYNVTFAKLKKYLEKNNVELPQEETGYDHHEGGLGSVFPMPGGLKENIEFYFGKKVHVTSAEGFGVYSKLDTLAETPENMLPDIFDVLNCDEGCNVGSAVTREKNIFEIGNIMSKRRHAAPNGNMYEYYSNLYRSYDDRLELARFMRKYRKRKRHCPVVTEAAIEDAFKLLGKNDSEKRQIDCGACGSATCLDMARKIALGVSIPTSCMVTAMESARYEHEQSLAAHEKIATMEKQREVDEHMRVLLAANPHVAIIFNDKFKVVDCNPASVEYFGFDTKEELISGFADRVAVSLPEYQSDGRRSIPLNERFATVVREGSVKFETDIILGGIARALDVEFKRIPYGDSFAVVVYVVDVTDIHKREVELKQARATNELQLTKLNLAVKATKIGLWDMEIKKDDADNMRNVFNWSNEFRQLMGFKDEADFPNVLSSWSDRLHPDDKERVLDAIKKHMYDTTGQTPYDVECRLMKKNGEYSYYRTSGETIRDEFGDPVRIAGAMLDITEAKNILLETEKQKREAESANRAKSDFLSAMSHEIRTPMNAILGITEMLLQNETLDASAREALGKVYVSGDMLLGIINDILDLSRIESGKLELICDNYETASLISDTAQLNMMRIGSKPIEFELHVDEYLPTLLIGDELRVKQICNNILSNAFKYTAAGTVKLTVSADAGDANEDDTVTLIISVSDTGQGMSKDQIDQLFDKYTRFNMEVNRSTEGTGLGMSITQNLVKLMNGEISVESEPGKGTTFTVRLPQGRVNSEVMGAEMVENLKQFRTSSRTQMKRVQISREPMPYGSVLIVDDVETNIFVARGLMTSYNLRIDSADSGFAAIEKVKSGDKYDIIFMDHMMPKMDGIEATKIIRGMGYEHPIVALTANAVAGQADIFLKNGFDDFISKPIDIRQLNNVLNKLIRDKQPPEVIEAARRQALQKEKSPESAKQPTIDPRIAEAFLHDAAKSIAVLDSIMQKKGACDDVDVRTYVIHVHGMKSALANIGNMELSAVALKLESLGRDGNLEAITSETPAFIDSLRSLVDVLMPENEQEDDESADEDTPFLHEKLLEIKSACEEYDETRAEDALAEISKKQWSRQTKALLKTLSEHLLHSDFDEVASAVDAFVQPR